MGPDEITTEIGIGGSDFDFEPIPDETFAPSDEVPTKVFRPETLAAEPPESEPELEDAIFDVGLLEEETRPEPLIEDAAIADLTGPETPFSFTSTEAPAEVQPAEPQAGAGADDSLLAELTEPGSAIDDPGQDDMVSFALDEPEPLQEFDLGLADEAQEPPFAGSADDSGIAASLGVAEPESQATDPFGGKEQIEPLAPDAFGGAED